jgi:4-hydroxy-tetrahydrodipicolinate reductase
MIGERILKHIKRKKTVVTDKLERAIEPSELHIASVRGGSIPGIHSVAFDSDADTIELKHTARSREGFALGAVLAAEFIRAKEGIFTMKDVLNI